MAESRSRVLGGGCHQSAAKVAGQAWPPAFLTPMGKVQPRNPRVLHMWTAGGHCCCGLTQGHTGSLAMRPQHVPSPRTSAVGTPQGPWGRVGPKRGEWPPVPWLSVAGGPAWSPLRSVSPTLGAGGSGTPSGSRCACAVWLLTGLPGGASQQCAPGPVPRGGDGSLARQGARRGTVWGCSCPQSPQDTQGRPGRKDAPGTSLCPRWLGFIVKGQLALRKVETGAPALPPTLGPS